MNKLFIITLVVLAFSASADWYQSDLTILGAAGSIDPVLNSTEATFDFDSILCSDECKINESGGDNDFYVKGENHDDMLYGDASTDRIGIGTNTPGASLEVSGDTQLNGPVTINEDSGDYDFRIEGDGNANLFVTDAGNDRIGIGTASPVRLLHIQESGAGANLMQFGNSDTGATTSDGFQIGITNAEKAQFYNAENTDMEFYCNGGATPKMVIAADGSIEILAFKDVSGTPVEWDGTRLTKDTSALKYKKDIVNIADELDTSKVYDLRPVMYTRKSSETGEREIGIIADEAVGQFPELITYANDEIEGFRYSRLAVLLLEEMKKLKAKNEELEARIKKLEE